MWIPKSPDIFVQRNAVLPMGFQVIDPLDEQPFNLEPYTLTCGIKYAAGSGSILDNPEVRIIDASIGRFDILFDGRELSAVPGAQEVVTLAYEVLATDIDGPSVIMLGTIYLAPGVL